MSQPHYLEVARRRQPRWWHDHIIDDMLANPFSTLAERGKRLGYSPAWLHTLTKSDMFQAAYRARKGSLNDQLRDSIALKMGKVADKHLEVMLEQLETKRTNIPFADLAASTNTVLERLGFGSPKGSAQTVVNVQQNGSYAPAPVSAEVLAEARARLRSNEAKLIPQGSSLDELAGDAKPGGEDA